MGGDHDRYVEGVSTRKVDDLVKALGVDSGVSKSTVSRICAELDEQIAAFRQRRLDHATFPYVFCDATYVKARSLEGRVVSRAVIAAFGVAADGTREVLGVDVGDSEDETSRRRPRMQVVEQHREHQPIRVYDALELDEHRRPTRWLYHVECLNCGQQFVPPPDADDQ